MTSSAAIFPRDLVTANTLAHEERLVKRGALAFFRAVRVVVTQSREVPGIVQRAADDIRAAWQESARPNA